MNRVLKALPVIFLGVLSAAVPARVTAQDKGTVVEEIVARVNNSIITLSDLQKADQSLRDEVAAWMPELHAGSNQRSV